MYVRTYAARCTLNQYGYVRTGYRDDVTDADVVNDGDVVTDAEHVDKDRRRSAMAASPAVPTFVAAAAVPAVPAMAESNIRTER